MSSGLTGANYHKAVNMTLQAAILGYHNRERVGYTQGPMRWEGIDRDRKAWRGEYPREADCSAYVTWCLWNGLDHFHIRDIVNGLHWQGGFTGTLLTHGRRVWSPIPGDLVIYGYSYPGKHVSIYTGGGLCVSHGSWRGPLLVPYRYRPDILSIRRYI